MPFVAVLCLVLLLLAALGSTLWWRGETQPFNNWSVYYWGIFFLALYITWPTFKALL